MGGTHSFFIPLIFHLSLVLAHVTVYNIDGPSPTRTAAPGVYTGLQAFNPIVLEPPPVPSPPPPTKFDLRLKNGINLGLSIKQNGTFFGFSIEFASASEIRACSVSTFANADTGAFIFFCLSGKEFFNRSGPFPQSHGEP